VAVFEDADFVLVFVENFLLFPGKILVLLTFTKNYYKSSCEFSTKLIQGIQV
jgi:hypothetical protein